MNTQHSAKSLRTILLAATTVVVSAMTPACIASQPAPVELVRTSGYVEAPHLEAPAPLPALTLLAPVAPSAEPETETHQIVILAMDGVRWQEIFDGVDARLAKEHGLAASDVVDAKTLLPHLYAAIDKGFALGAPGHGAPIVASGPNFASLPGYLEMLTGRPSSRCERNDCPPTKERTLLDECREMPGVSEDDVALISSWENIERAAASDPSRMVISAGRHHGFNRDHLRRDARSSALLDKAAKSFPSPGQDDYRADRFTAPIALSYLESERPRCLFIGLGDPDEQAHLSNYRAYLASLKFIDKTVGELFARLDSMGDYGKTTSVWITADHGRARDFTHHGRKAPESARVWLVAAGGSIPSLGFVSASETRRLADLAPSLRVQLGLHADDNALAGRPLWEALPREPAPDLPAGKTPERSAALGQ